MNDRQEPEHVPGKIVVLVLGGAVLIAALAVAVEALMLARAQPRAQLRSALPREMSAVSGIQQRTFDRTAVGNELKAAQLRHLASYGWVDRGRGVIHVPIERAIDLWIERSRSGQDADLRPSVKPPGAEIQRTEPGRTRRSRSSKRGASP
jgi:hypothetical protein